MKSLLICVSHSPIIMIRAKPPAHEPEILAFYDKCRHAIERFHPEQVVIFGCDHYSGFHLSLMPAYCIGLDATAVDDVGGFPGTLKVPAEAAVRLIHGLRDDGFDPAVSRRMRIDHGFSQPLYRLLGGHDRYPTIPIFIGSMTPPYLPFFRSRKFGESVGRQMARLDKRTLFLGSGGLSHHPTRYYPLLGDATPDVYAYQLDGERGGTMTDAAWFSRLRKMHEEGAVMLTDGRRTPRDIRLAPDVDRRFLAQLCSGDIAAFDAWDAESLVQEGGIGFLEVHAWIAALAAHRAAGGSSDIEQIYSPTLEYGIGYGMLIAQN